MEGDEINFDFTLKDIAPSFRSGNKVSIIITVLNPEKLYF